VLLLARLIVGWDSISAASSIPSAFNGSCGDRNTSLMRELVWSSRASSKCFHLGTSNQANSVSSVVTMVTFYVESPPRNASAVAFDAQLMRVGVANLITATNCFRLALSCGNMHTAFCPSIPLFLVRMKGGCDSWKFNISIWKHVLLLLYFFLVTHDEQINDCLRYAYIA